MDRKERVQPSKRPARSSYFFTYMNRELKIHLRELKAKMKTRDREVMELETKAKKVFCDHNKAMKNIIVQLGKSIHQSGKDRKMKNYQLAAEIGISEAVLSLLSNGQYNLGEKYLAKIEAWVEKLQG